MITHLATSASEVFWAVDSVTPENPPIAEALYKLLRYLLWFVLFGGLAAIIYGGGTFAWEKWNGLGGESTRMIMGACIGGIIAMSAAGILNAVLP
ncbi:hypothetical protein [Nocardia brasiliensis]|uniref:hypothetical protein n=1 Tax=Nocardia brasiliensis TaxID=37326 RepID=UPI002454B051|nr:hypothetical protein [Nocardia brasiliensis]